jgi:hypothetical protein
MEMIVLTDEADRKRPMRVSRRNDRCERPPRVERHRGASSMLAPSTPSPPADRDLVDVVASVIAITVLVVMLVLPHIGAVAPR